METVQAIRLQSSPEKTRAELTDEIGSADGDDSETLLVDADNFDREVNPMSVRIWFSP
jgi:hypothetical protein